MRYYEKLNSANKSLCPSQLAAVKRVSHPLPRHQYGVWAFGSKSGLENRKKWKSASLFGVVAGTSMGLGLVTSRVASVLGLLGHWGRATGWVRGRKLARIEPGRLRWGSGAGVAGADQKSGHVVNESLTSGTTNPLRTCGHEIWKMAARLEVSSNLVHCPLLAVLSKQNWALLWV